MSAAQHPPKAEWFWSELDVLREHWDPLRHSFHARWSSGDLTPRQLQLYAEEHDHLVTAVAKVTASAAGKADGLLGETLVRLSAAKHAELELWRQFAKGTGWCAASAWHYAEDPFPETVACARDWSGRSSSSLAKDLVTLYAIESCQPSLARMQLDGLVAHYGFDETTATRYFRRRAGLAEDHAALAQAALAGLLSTEDPFILIDRAEAIHRGYWAVLDRLEDALRA